MPPDRSAKSGNSVLPIVEKGCLSRQVDQAKEMGYSESHIWRALELANRQREGRAKSSSFLPFPSASAMIDALEAVQRVEGGGREEGGGTSGQQHRHTTPSGRGISSTPLSASNPRPNILANNVPAQSIGRSTSLNEGVSGNRTNGIQRLIDTFEVGKWAANGLDGRHLKRKLELSLRKEAELREQLERGQIRMRKLEGELKRKEWMEKEWGRMKGRNDELEGEMAELNVAMDKMRMEKEGSSGDAELTEQVEMLKKGLQVKDELLLDALAGPQLELERLGQELEEARRQCRELVQKEQCQVCMSGNREVLFMPCLHFVCCKHCSALMQNCSICRLRIMGKIELFQ